MALRTNAQLTLTSYATTDDGYTLTFTCADPGPGENSDWPIFITDAELSAASTPALRATLARNKLVRRYRNTATLDSLIGASVTI